jgi:hypothetical protein
MAASRGNPLDTRTIERLTKLLGMLGSEFAGERAAAGAKVEQLRRDLGMTWAELLQSVAPPEPELGEREINSDDLNVALANPDALTAWELDFVQSISRYYSALTPKQAACLARLANKARAYRGGASS